MLGWGQSSGSRTRGLALCPRNCKLRLVQTGRAAPLSTAPFSSCQGTDLMDLPTCCSSHPCPKLAGLEVPVRQPKAVSCGKDVLRRQPEREDGQGPGVPSAEVELSLLSTGIGLLPTLMFEVRSGEQEPSLSPCQG